MHERLAISSADIDELDLARAYAHLEERAPALARALSREELLCRAGYLAKTAPRYVPTLAGLYLFGISPELVHPEWSVCLVAFAGVALSDDIVARDDLGGSLFQQRERAIAFAAEHGGAADASGPAYDVRTMAEAITNALIHRDLRRPARVAIRVFHDRIEVWSPGGPPEGAPDLEELSREGGVSLPRNPLVAATARAFGVGEQLGRGLHRIMSAEGREKSELRTSPRDVLVVVPSRWSALRTKGQLS